MTINKKIKSALICELKTSALPSDQKIADKLGVSRGTVWNQRNEIENEVLSYLGRNFINFRLKQMTRTLLRLQSELDYLENLKDSTNVKLIKNFAIDSSMNKMIPFIDIKHLPISINEKIRIVKEQRKIESLIIEILTSGILKATNIESIIDNPIEKWM